MDSKLSKIVSKILPSPYKAVALKSIAVTTLQFTSNRALAQAVIIINQYQ